MNPERLDLICQQCGAVLHFGADAARCENGHRYPLVLGRILDMIADQEDAGDPEELPLAAAMSLAFEQATYAELLLVLEGYHSEVPDHLKGVYTDYTRSAIQRNRRMTLAFRGQASQWYDLSPDGSALELGCGYGGNFPVLAQLYKQVAGIEPSLPRLIAAAKLLDEQNIHNVRLVRAYAQRVPFRDACFDYVTGINVMEHVLDVEGVMQEVHRLLRSGGIFLADSRNRYDLFFLEPHVKLRFVGFLPRTMARKYVRWRTGLSYDKTKLLSCGDWSKALSKADWRYHITLAKAQAYGYSAKADLFLEKLSRVPLLRRLLLAIAPSHLVVAEKRARDA